MAADPLVPRPLFGGAISILLPQDYIDASDLRQVPDNQEVFLSSASDTSLVIEVLSMVEEGQASSDLWEATKFHFESIAHDNSSLSTTVLTPSPGSPVPSRPLHALPTETLDSTPQPVILTGLQKVHKYSQDPSGAPRPGHEGDDPDEVWIGVALWRCWVEQVRPLEDAPVTDLDTGGGHGVRKKKADLVYSVNVNLSASDGNGYRERQMVEAWWQRSVGSLRIEDWNLFGDEE
ncbi:hypothetical protein M231_02707 [Tremella mesenterica]|uniref:Uncharacterized protein n=1 Tax=Tremella mesenterica TaxID=5217 RepID=A0A4V1M4E3_TREME|nr:hypothetical protein M231_02707 [Tremella mesenterica]